MDIFPVASSDVRGQIFQRRQGGQIGQAPWLTDGDLSIFESGAILLHLGERSHALADADQMAHFAAADAA